MVALLKLPEGVQAKVPVPVAFSVVLPPEQMVSSIPALTEGRGFTVTETVSVLLQPLASVAYKV